MSSLINAFVVGCLTVAVTHALTNTCYIVPNGTSSVCPNTSDPCTTLPQFVSSPRSYLRDSSYMDIHFLPGYHILQSELTMEDFQEVLVFGMVGTKSSSGVTINGNGTARLIFSEIDEIRIEHINFIGFSTCTLESIHTNLLINNCSFTNSTGTALELMFIGNVVLSSSTFTSNVGSLRKVTETVRTNKHYLAGGALYLLENSNFLIDKCTFINNSAEVGGVIYAMSSYEYGDGRNVFRIRNCSFNDNRLVQHSPQEDDVTYNDGVVFYCEIGTQCTVTVTTSIFRDNTNTHGLALFAVRHGGIAIQYSMFTDNFGAIISAEGGSELQLFNDNFVLNMNWNAHACGGLFQISRSSLTVNRCNFTANSIYSQDDGGAIVCSVSSHLSVFSSNFRQNYANCTGGVFFLDYQSSLISSNSRYDSNTANVYGGVLHVARSSRVEAYSNVFANNSAITKGGGVFSCDEDSTSYFTLQNNTFLHNGAHLGGGVLSAYNANVSMVNNVFLHNFAGIGGVIEATGGTLSIILCNFFQNTAEQTGGVGALYELTLVVTHSDFYANTASDGGVFFTRGTEINSSIDRSTFTLNVARDFGAVFYGGSNKLKLTLQMLRLTNNSAALGVVYCQKCSQFYVRYTSFSFNNGSLFMVNSKVTIDGDTEFVYSTSNLEPSSDVKYEEGGAITCIQSELTFTDHTQFTGNTARQGGAIMLSETKLYIMYATILLFSGNHATVSGGGMYLFQSEIFSGGHIVLKRNTAVKKGGAMHVIGTRLNIRFASPLILGTLHVFHNTAEEGGGIFFEGNSKLYLSKEDPFSHFTTDKRKSLFISNKARYGGAIFIADGTDSGTCASVPSNGVQSITTECTLQVLALHDFIGEGYILPKNFDFSNNTASISGDDLYGGLLDRCKASFYAEVRQAYNGKSMSEDDYLGVPYLKNISNIHEDKVSSGPIKLCFCRNGTQDCSITNFTLTAMKGEKKTVELVAVDQVERPVFATIRSYLSSESSGLGEGQLTQYITDACSEIELAVSSANDSELVTLYAEGPCKDIGISKQLVTISFQACECPIGFKPNENVHTRCDCVCDDVISSLHATCDIESRSIIRHANFWLTYVGGQEGYLVYPECPFDYCRPPRESVSINLNLPHGADSQCKSNRVGRLCGACQPGYSTILGSTKCSRCSTSWIALVIAFAFLGLALVVFILYLNLTVAVGTINGLTLYANIVMANREIYIPTTNFFSVFISWLNLDFGIESCLYNGMDSYAKVWLRFLFPLYIISLVVLIIIVSERWGKFAKLLTYKNPVATLSTLILLSYTQLLRTIISSFSFAILEYPNGSKKVVWLVDANVDYFGAKHVLLLLAAILIVVCGLAYTIFLFSWQWLLQLNSERVIFKWIKNTRLNSFMDAYHAPYNFKYRYWTGLLLLVRVALYLVASIIQNMFADAKVNLVFTTLLVTGICILRGYLKISLLYKKWPLDILELTFYFNTIIFSVATLYVRGSGRGDQSTIAALSVSITLVIFASIVLYHIHTHLLLKHTIWPKIVAMLRQRIGRDQQLNGNEVNIDFEEHLINPYDKAEPTKTVIEKLE